MESFFGVGFWEILLLLVVGLALLGPRKLPQIAAKMGAMFRQLKRASFDLTNQLSREVDGTADKKPSTDSLNSLKQAASDLKAAIVKEPDDPPQQAEETSPNENEKPKAQA